MWPFDRGVVLTLYLGTLALHAVFVGYVVIGSAYALIRRTDPVAATVRDRLPFMLGCGITAGVAPLLFIQLMHQRRFYTANLLLGPRWFAVVPALVVGFYALYLAKSSERFCRTALAVALACFAFVAYSWSELHELMQADPSWADFYAAGHRVFTVATIVPRFVIALGAMAALFAAVGAWAADAVGRSRIAVVAVVGRVVAVLGAVWLWKVGFAVTGPAVAWFGVLVAASVIDTGAWLVAMRRPTDRVLAVATAGGAAALIAAAVVREAPRIALIETQPQAAVSGGAVAFAIALVLGIAAIAWVVRQIRT